jgi:hypothetical protein
MEAQNGSSVATGIEAIIPAGGYKLFNRRGHDDKMTWQQGPITPRMTAAVGLDANPRLVEARAD